MRTLLMRKYPYISQGISSLLDNKQTRRTQIHLSKQFPKTICAGDFSKESSGLTQSPIPIPSPVALSVAPSPKEVNPSWKLALLKTTQPNPPRPNRSRISSAQRSSDVYFVLYLPIVNPFHPALHSILPPKLNTNPAAHFNSMQCHYSHLSRTRGERRLH